MIQIKKFKIHSLQNRIALAITIFFVIIFLIFLFLTHHSHQHFLNKQFDSHLLALAGYVASTSSNKSAEENRVDFNQLGHLFIQERDLQFIIIYDPENKVSLSRTRVDGENLDFVQPLIAE